MRLNRKKQKVANSFLSAYQLDSNWYADLIFVLQANNWYKLDVQFVPIHEFYSQILIL